MNDRGVRIAIHTYTDHRKNCRRKFVGKVEFSSAPDHFSGTSDRFCSEGELLKWQEKAMAQYQEWTKKHNFFELPNF